MALEPFHFSAFPTTLGKLLGCRTWRLSLSAPTPKLIFTLLGYTRQRQEEFTRRIQKGGLRSCEGGAAKRSCIS